MTGGRPIGNEGDWSLLRREAGPVYAIFEKEVRWTERERDYCSRPGWNHDYLNGEDRKRARHKGQLLQLVCDLLLQNIHEPAKTGILYFFHESQHLRCEPIEPLYAHSHELTATLSPQQQQRLERTMQSIIDDARDSARRRLSAHRLYTEPYCLEELALFKTAAFLTPSLYQRNVRRLIEELSPFAERTSVMYIVLKTLSWWSRPVNDITEDDLQYRDVFAPETDSPESRSRSGHTAWFYGGLSRDLGRQLLGANRYEAQRIIRENRDTIRANTISTIHRKCFEAQNAADAQTNLLKTWLTLETADAWERLTVEEAGKVLDMICLARSMKNAAKCKALESARIRWIMKEIEKKLRNPPYYLDRQILSDQVRHALDNPRSAPGRSTEAPSR